MIGLFRNQKEAKRLAEQIEENARKEAMKPTLRRLEADIPEWKYRPSFEISLTGANGRALPESKGTYSVSFRDTYYSSFRSFYLSVTKKQAQELSELFKSIANQL